MLEKRAVTRVPIADLLARRWSGRAYDPERPLAPERRDALLEAARWAPSCYGEEPWRYLVFERDADRAGWTAAFECLAKGNQAWARHAVLLILATADNRFARNGDRPNRWGQYDTGAASVSLCLQAVSLGLVAHQMGGFDAEAARRRFDIPDRYTPMAMIAVGYPLPPERVPGALREREAAPRQRVPLGERFFRGRWGRPVDAPEADGD